MKRIRGIKFVLHVHVMTSGHAIKFCKTKAVCFGQDTSVAMRLNLLKISSSSVRHARPFFFLIKFTIFQERRGRGYKHHKLSHGSIFYISTFFPKLLEEKKQQAEQEM